MAGRFGRRGYRGRNAKVDGNQQAIIDAYRAVGATVVEMGKPLDLLVGYKRKTLLVEVKNPEGKNRFEKQQTDFINEWQGDTIHVVRNAAEALALLKTINQTVDPIEQGAIRVG